MKEMIEARQALAESNNQLPDSILNKLKRKATDWDQAPVIRLNSLSPADKKMINKLRYPNFDWSKVYDEWPDSPAAADFDTKPPSISFVIEGEDGEYYLISTEGYNYARYIARIV